MSARKAIKQTPHGEGPGRDQGPRQGDQTSGNLPFSSLFHDPEDDVRQSNHRHPYPHLTDEKTEAQGVKLFVKG